MPKVEPIKILERGINAWNAWRNKNPSLRPNLSGANLAYADLAQVNFSKTNLRKANLAEANLEDANLREANLCKADLYGAELGDADLSKAVLCMTRLHRANLHFANLSGADLRRAQFIMAELSQANLHGANLNGAMLSDAELYKADLSAADLSGAHLGGTSFRKTNLTETNLNACVMALTVLADVDLSRAKNLKMVQHIGPSTIGLDTIYRSQNNIPVDFLRGAGIPDSLIKNIALVSAMESIQFYSCFISYSSNDQQFVERLHADLQSKGVPCWFAPEDLKIGDPLRSSFDEAIRIHDKLMVILSSNSVKSPWVEKEVETAFEKEREQNRIVLFPICLDAAVMETKQAWAADIRRTRHIGDFRGWKNHSSYKKAFDRLLRDLKAEGKSEPAQE